MKKVLFFGTIIFSLLISACTAETDNVNVNVNGTYEYIDPNPEFVSIQFRLVQNGNNVTGKYYWKVFNDSQDNAFPDWTAVADITGTLVKKNQEVELMITFRYTHQSLKDETSNTTYAVVLENGNELIIYTVPPKIFKKK